MIESGESTLRGVADVARVRVPAPLLLAIFAAQRAGAIGKIYWVDASLGTVERADPDGSNVESIETGANGPNGIALDPIGDRVYWTECCGGNSLVRRAARDGSNPETVVPLAGGFPYHVALDLGGGRIFWADQAASGSTHRTNLDGTNATMIVGPASDDSPRGIALDVFAGKVYWGDAFGIADGSRIRRANFDGSGIEVLVSLGDSDPISQPEGIAIDATAGKLYWADSMRHEIRRVGCGGGRATGGATPERGLPGAPPGGIPRESPRHVGREQLRDLVAIGLRVHAVGRVDHELVRQRLDHVHDDRGGHREILDLDVRVTPQDVGSEIDEFALDLVELGAQLRFERRLLEQASP